jgi:hypothetical protein
MWALAKIESGAQFVHTSPRTLSRNFYKRLARATWFRTEETKKNVEVKKSGRSEKKIN